MGYYEKLLMISKIKEAMMDKKSEILFDAKIDYMITRDADQFYEVSDSLEKSWYCKELDKALEKKMVKDIIIFGCGHDGIRTKKILENCNYTPKFFCDSDINKVGKVINGLEVISVDTLLSRYTEYLTILGSARYADEIYRLLRAKMFPAENILYPQYKILFAKCGNQYFDLFSVGDNEVFIDGGSYDGNTILDFVDWSEGKYRKIYAFEPIPKMFQFIKKRIEEEKVESVKLYENALWNKKENLYFLENKSGSRVTGGVCGATLVRGIALDDVIKDEKVSFIKLDVEGSELNTLKGAERSIINNHPKLAICIYHKPEDILEIPAYILSLVPEYKFYVRHYTSCMWETVLYAQV